MHRANEPLLRKIPSIRRRRPTVTAMAMALVVSLWASGARAEDCPRPLLPMPVVVEEAATGLIRRRPLEITSTRIVFADYLHSPSWRSEIVDVGVGWMENRSDVRRRVRYHHEFPIDMQPMILTGSIASGSTLPASFDFRIGCDALDPRAFYHVIAGEADRVVMRVEAVLEPGQRVAMWWNVALEVSVAGRLPNDRNGDGTVDLHDLSVALASLGSEDPDREVEALRSLLRGLDQ